MAVGATLLEPQPMALACTVPTRWGVTAHSPVENFYVKVASPRDSDRNVLILHAVLMVYH